ncbi:MAG: endolytic transglycosylase MltG [Patescibacteria group bacterium]
MKRFFIVFSLLCIAVASLVVYFAASTYIRKVTEAKNAVKVPVREEVTIRIIEGWTIYDIQKELEGFGLDMQPSDFLAERFVEDFYFLKNLPPGATLEGYLFPDTYRVWKDELPDGLFRKQLAEFSEKTETFGTTTRDVVILASIIEKEARQDKDRPIVAGIFANRLSVGMALQSDATLNYVIRSGRDRLNAEELKNDSPYNSYQHRELPPGPISNPGLASLEAAFHPAKTDFWYFLTNKDGIALFAKNLEGHAANRRAVNIP